MGRPLRPCGTLAAYNRHRYRNEPPCEACKDAHSAYQRELRARTDKAPRELTPCGTEGAWTRHRRAGEQPCEACEEAHRFYKYTRQVARMRAYGRLARTYATAYKEMLAEELQEVLAEEEAKRADGGAS